MILLGGKTRFDCQNIDDSFLKTGGQKGYIGHSLLSCLHTHACILALLFVCSSSVRFTVICLRRGLLSRGPFSKMEHGSLQATKAEIIRATQPGAWETIGRAS